MKNEDVKRNPIDLRVSGNGENYLDGNAARVLEDYVQTAEPIRIPREHEIRRYEVEPDYEKGLRPRVGRAVDLFFAAVLCVAIMVTLYICINYLQIQSDIVQLEKQVSSLEKNISLVESENVALERMINAESCNLDQVYNIAVGTLGMVYPNNNEVHFYQNEGSSYYIDYSEVR
ncbi:MAG: hypothetical protein K6G60_09945 [Lachnospiraceae bacterium]|nr:hypothetical protein [Lachnospiraceae bacterium]